MHVSPTASIDHLRIVSEESVMAQSVMTGVIDGTFAGYGLRFAPDSEMPVIRDFRAKSIWQIDLAKRVSRVRQV